MVTHRPIDHPRIRVQLLSSVFVDRGAERTMLWLQQKLPKERYEVRIASLRDLAPFAQRLSASGQDIVDVIGMRHQLDFWALIKLYRYLRRRRPHILHIHSLRAAIWGRPIARLAQVPVVLYSVHNKWGGRLHRLFDRWSSRYGDATIPFSRAVRNYLLEEVRLDSKKVTDPIYIGVNTDRFKPQSRTEIDWARTALGIDSDAPLIGFVGALSEQKGLTYLMRALVTLKPEFPKIRCLIVGEGPQGESLKNAAQGLGLQDTVLFLGQRYDTPLLLHMIDIFVLPSLWEGLPQAVVEAMATGLPVVATAVDGTPELVHDEVTGLLVPPCDCGALGDAIRRLLRDSRLRSEIGRRAQAHVLQNFDVMQMISGFDRAYRRLLQEEWAGPTNGSAKRRGSGEPPCTVGSQADSLRQYVPLPNPHSPWIHVPTYDAGPLHYFVTYLLSSRFRSRRVFIALLRLAVRLGLLHLWTVLSPAVARILCEQK